MAKHEHLIIPFASSLDEGCQAAIKTLALPNLSKFLKIAELSREDNGDEFDFIPPHERIWLEANQDGASQPSVLLTPCHWLVGIDRISMANPADLQLTEEESQTLFALLRPYFLEDGIELMYSAPLRWYASGNSLSGIPFASLHRVIGRNVDAWQPPAAHSKAIRRLQNEIQMLLYKHPINEARAARGLPTVNSFWLSQEILPTDNTDFSLTNHALASDWQSWATAWVGLDQKISNCTSLTLCGERHAKTHALPTTTSIWRGLQRLLRPQPSIHAVLGSL